MDPTPTFLSEPGSNNAEPTRPATFASPELTGGAGFTFENVAVAVYLAALLAEQTAPALPDRVVTKVAVQQAPFGEPMDDLIVDGTGQDGATARVSLQAKRSLVVSAAPSNTDFREVVERAWQTVQRDRFQVGTDRVGAVVETISEVGRRALVTAYELARASGDNLDCFQTHLVRGAGRGADIRRVVDDVAAILRKAAADDPDAAAFKVLRHFVLVRLDTLHEGATTDPAQIALLRTCLRPDQADRAGAMWQTLCQKAHEGAGRAKTFLRDGLLAELRPAFAFAGSPRFRHALEVLHEEARLALGDIRNTIGTVSLNRTTAVEGVRRAMDRHRFVQIVGLPGVGKSAVLRALAQQHADVGPVLVLKADRVEATNWHAHAARLGIGSAPLATLLAELAAVADPVIFIDGLDRFGVEQHGVVTDLLRAALGNTTPWRVVASVRDNGTEPLKTWLPDEVWAEGVVGDVEIRSLDKDEATTVAQAQPALQPLLFGDVRVREVARRPFFAAVLARALADGYRGALVVPGSEVELAQVWWDRGGHDAAGAHVAKRQQVLLTLAHAGAASPGNSLSVSSLDPDVVESLVQDGLLRRDRRGHRVTFMHDIFHEWALLHLLLDRGDQWVGKVWEVGEPPALGRVVELLAETMFSDGAGWDEQLAQVEGSDLRPQWTRAWLLGPFGSPAFPDKAQDYAKAVFSGDGARCAKVATWFQAEKTRANPQVLDGQLIRRDVTPRERIRLADLVAWPSDIRAWSRYLGWALDHAQRIPTGAWPHVVEGFQVWQNCFADWPNQLSERIIRTVQGWLEHIESDSVNGVTPPGALLAAAGTILLGSLRALVLRHARVGPETVRAYLSRPRGRGRHERGAYEQILSFSPTLVPALATDLVDRVLERSRRPLPEEAETLRYEQRDKHALRFTQPFSYHDWQELALDHDVGFSPPSPLREPFRSLFQAAPAEGLRLVRELANHAISAWSQLYRLDPERRATPIPLVLVFPWGRQVCAGDEQVYRWFRGHGAPTLLTSGLMALEQWAFDEVEHGRDVEEIIEEVVRGHVSCATLGIAIMIALHTNRLSRATLPLATSQRLWKWDIHRCVQDMSSGFTLIGFMGARDADHIQALKVSNARQVRRQEVRALAQLFVSLGGADLGSAAATAIQAFPSDLPFDFEEEARSPELVAPHRRRAEIWSQIGRRENYTATTMDGGTAVQIAFDSPTNKDADVQQGMERHAALTEVFGILNWGRKSFEEGPLNDPTSLTDILAAARRLDDADLFEGATSPGEDRDLRRNAVALVAAAALASDMTLTQADLDWATDVTGRACAVAEEDDTLWTSKALLQYHPCLSAAHGLAGLIRRGIERDATRRALITLAAHPLEQVSETALALAMSFWDEDTHLAWTALGLGIRLSVVRLSEIRSQCRAAVAPAAMDAAQEAARQLDAVGPLQELPTLPTPWAFVPRPEGTRHYEDEEKVLLREPEVALRWDVLPRLFPHIPLERVMATPHVRAKFLGFCDSMLVWTIDRIDPFGQARSGRRRWERDGSDVFEWRLALCRFLARVALQLPLSEALDRFVRPMVEMGDETAVSLLDPFADRVARCGVMDPPDCAPQAIPLLSACADRILRCRGWCQARRHDGMISGFELPSLARTLLFVQVDGASGAARFANGDWRDLGLVMPVIDAVVREVGDVTTVVSSFVELCERAVEHYPVETFVAQVLAILKRQPGTPAGWRRNGIPSRLAGLVQEFAERARPLSPTLKLDLLRILDALVDMGDRRAAALQTSELFRDARLPIGPRG